MPWTFAHPAAVVPLWRRFSDYLSLPSLIIGAMVPDMGFFLIDPVPRHVSHSLPGLFTFSLPYGILTCIIFFKLLYNPSLFLLPNAWLNRLKLQRTLPSILPIILSVFLGALSHIWWDGITHEGTWFNRLFPYLNMEAYRWFGDEIKYYRVLQHLSTIIGSIYLIVQIRKWIVNSPRVNEYETFLMSGSFYRLILLILGSSALMTFLEQPTTDTLDYLNLFFNLGVHTIEFSLLVYLVYSVWWHFIIRKKYLKNKILNKP